MNFYLINEPFLYYIIRAAEEEWVEGGREERGEVRWGEQDQVNQHQQ